MITIITMIPSLVIVLTQNSKTTSTFLEEERSDNPTAPREHLNDNNNNNDSEFDYSAHTELKDHFNIS